jgi:hypothetical protein
MLVTSDLYFADQWIVFYFRTSIFQYLLFWFFLSKWYLLSVECFISNFYHVPIFQVYHWSISWAFRLMVWKLAGWCQQCHKYSYCNYHYILYWCWNASFMKIYTCQCKVYKLSYCTFDRQLDHLRQHMSLQEVRNMMTICKFMSFYFWKPKFVIL